MSFHPGILLSSAARARCMANIKEIPAFFESNIPDRVRSSVLVPLCVVNEEVCLLYTLRSSNLVRHSGQVSFPGGKMDSNETVVDTALRETEEEIGFPRVNVDVWGVMSDVQGRDPRIVIHPVIGQLNNFDSKNLIPNEAEVEEVFTVLMEDLCNTNNHAHMMYKTLLLPIFQCGRHKVWGVTGLITHLFLQSLFPSDVYNPNFMRKSYTIEDLLPSKL